MWEWKTIRPEGNDSYPQIYIWTSAQITMKNVPYLPSIATMSGDADNLLLKLKMVSVTASEIN